MRAVRLHGPRDLRVEDVPSPPPPGPGDVQIRVSAVGICGSDLHAYRSGGIADAVARSPLVLGHEFAGRVAAAGQGALDGNGAVLHRNTLVAVDPAQPCGQCERCRMGDPNLCLQLRFCGLAPDDGALCELINIPGSTCFPLPDAIDAAAGAMLEPLGVALHAIRLAKVKAGNTVSVHGAGPIGLLIVRLARLVHAEPVFVTERLPWRLQKAADEGAVPVSGDRQSRVVTILEATAGRGVDVAVEAGWADVLVQEAIDVVRPGGRVVLVGIPHEDTLSINHSVARRKGLTLLFSRRMAFTYPHAIRLVENGTVNVRGLISHRFTLDHTPEAFALNDRYEHDVLKVMITPET